MKRKLVLESRELFNKYANMKIEVSCYDEFYSFDKFEIEMDFVPRKEDLFSVPENICTHSGETSKTDHAVLFTVHSVCFYPFKDKGKIHIGLYNGEY